MKIFITAILAITSVLGYSQNSNNVDSILREIYKQDQGVRKEVFADFASGDTDRIIAAGAKMQAVDAENQAVVFEILDSIGWPQNLSDTASSAIFLVIDHAELDAQQKYLHLIKQAAKNGDLAKSDCATLEDRILMGLNKPQIYGTQTKFFIHNGQQSPNYIWPIADNENVNNIRSEIGLPTIEEYLITLENAGFKTIWDQSLNPTKLLELYNIESIE